MSPMIRNVWSCGAMMLQVSRATTPEANVMQATEKSGASRSSGTSVCLSGARHAENAVTDRAGPKKAGNHVK